MTRANHIRAALNCGTHWPGPYLLVTQESQCGKYAQPSGDQRNSRVYQFDTVTVDAHQDHPSTIIVARSPSDPSQDWFSGQATLELGLPIWVQSRLDEYRRLYQDDRRAVFIDGHHIKTRDVPSLPKAGFLLSSDDSVEKSGKGRTTEFTTKIEDAIRNAPDRPVLLSIGTDGFSCNTGLFKSHFERVPSYDMVVRLHTLGKTNGAKLDPSHLQKTANSWWGKYPSEQITQRLENFAYNSTSAAINELVAVWNELQSFKDVMSSASIVSGRNMS
jgi:hypothetical protein